MRGPFDGSFPFPPSTAESAVVLFSCCKGETHTPNRGFKQLFRRLRTGFNPRKMEAQDFSPSTLRQAEVLILGNPRGQFMVSEFAMLRDFVKGGGSLLVLAEQGRSGAASGDQSNINYLLEEFGISANPDSVVRTAHYKYMHPRECHIADSALHPALTRLLGPGRAAAAAAAGGDGGPAASTAAAALELVYASGCTLAVHKPAVPVLSSGALSYPAKRPIGSSLACLFPLGPTALPPA